MSLTVYHNKTALTKRLYQTLDNTKHVMRQFNRRGSEGVVRSWPKKHSADLKFRNWINIVLVKLFHSFRKSKCFAKFLKKHPWKWPPDNLTLRNTKLIKLDYFIWHEKLWLVQGGNKFDFNLLENADSLMLPYLMAKAAIDLVIPVISQEHLV